MKSSLLRIVIVGTIVAFIISFSIMALAAEKKVFSINLKNEKIVSEKILHAYGSERIQIKQGESLYVILDSKDPSLMGAEQTVYWQQDIVIGHVGVERGYTITRTKDGDVFYSRYESTYKVIRKEWPKKEVQSSEKHQIFGGFQKFDSVTGSYSCHGTTTEKEQTIKCEGEWEY